MATPLSVDQLVDGVTAGERATLARAITLVESRLPADQRRAEQLVSRVMPHTGNAVRVGISGVPGVGKSSLIESLGMQLVAQGKRVAVLAVDPSSVLSGGSILGDKTRMVELSRHAHAFIRPSPAGDTVGGVARRTREAMLLCEAAGHSVVLVETVGVGQSEVEVASMVDTFMVLLLAGAGDELQGLKRGILELADVLAINKADGNNMAAAKAAQREYTAALHYLAPRMRNWVPPVATVSAHTGEGLSALWSMVLAHRTVLEKDGGLFDLRRKQNRAWMWKLVNQQVVDGFRALPAVAVLISQVEADLDAGRLSATAAAKRLLAAAAQNSP